MIYVYDKITKDISWTNTIDKDYIIMYSNNNIPMKNHVNKIYNAMIKNNTMNNEKFLRTIDVLENL